MYTDYCPTESVSECIRWAICWFLFEEYYISIKKYWPIKLFAKLSHKHTAPVGLKECPSRPLAGIWTNLFPINNENSSVQQSNNYLKILNNVVLIGISKTSSDNPLFNIILSSCCFIFLMTDILLIATNQMCQIKLSRK